MIHRVMNMWESGEIQRLRRKWYRDDDALPENPESISMEQVIPCMMVFVLGVLTSVLCLLVELWCADRGD
ncbi:hypothetical protein PR048_025024 [Dryococelus australis]|uniref:Uncharacterized protein n=1 Tax=Dryococelus australis TaxID=614101 RepID=A0ABQ9GQ74_9NEOP|nr:hypothetical protein PR048_025024 [Dryococelus australis]